MASTSVLLSKQKSFKYDVFLSFRGEDTRKNIVDHLYHALTRQGIDTYRDDEEIKKGKRIGEQLIRSIEDSKLYIIVFSKNYASSSWCLEELSKIIECQETDEHTAYVVFYDVEPTGVRKQIGAVGEAFLKHEGQESAGKWREALRTAADLAGWELKTTDDGHEAKFIQRVVKEISLELRFSCWSADPKLVGMETRVDVVVSSLEVDIGGVRMIGIKGIGGGGKTTLAKAVFDQLAYLYEGSSFVANVRESTKVSGLISLQKQVLSDVLLNGPDINVNGLSDLKSMMKKKMCRRKVLLVLDDVDHIDQLEALAGETNWFKPGSRVIITTRDEQVLVAHGVPKKLILNVNLLSHDEANCLFSRRAFGRVIPDHGFQMLSDQVLSYANGLPLTIKVLGSFLRAKDKHEWIDALERLKKIPLKDTLDILELSYNSLEEDYKEMFLDVACILKGWKKEKAIIALESCGFHATNGLNVLEQKSLITVSYGGHLEMHDHIEEMGKNIVRRLHLKEPYKHSRLWIQEEIEDILVEDKGTEATRCIYVKMTNPVTLMKGLRKMKELRFLRVLSKKIEYERISSSTCQSFIWHPVLYDQPPVSYNYDHNILYLPNSLQYLHWKNYPFRCLPKNFQADNLVSLQMKFGSMQELWEGGERKVLKKLKTIKFTFGDLRTLDIGLCPSLEKLELGHCGHLKELHMPTENFKLKSLRLFGCYLKTLDLMKAQNLKKLAISSDHLIELQLPIESLVLQDIFLDCSKLKTLKLTSILNLKSLRLDKCWELEEVHMPVSNFKLKYLSICNSKLKTLDLRKAQDFEDLTVKNCYNMVELHMPLESPMLDCIFLEKCSKLKALHLTSTLTQNLELRLEDCVELEELHMPVRNFKLQSLTIRNSKLKTLDLRKAQGFENLTIIDCYNMIELHIPLESLMLQDIFLILMLQGIFLECSQSTTLNLRRLCLNDCVELEKSHMPVRNFKLECLVINNVELKNLDLRKDQNIKPLIDKNCCNMVELHMPVVSLMLQDISLRCSTIKTLNLTSVLNLKRLCLEDCLELEDLQMPVRNFPLEFLRINNSKLKTLDLRKAQNFKTFIVRNCCNMVELHMPIESLMLEEFLLLRSKLKTLEFTSTLNLKKLCLTSCKKLEELHMPVDFKMESFNIMDSKLKTLDLAGALDIKKLDLDNCEELEELHMPVKNFKLEFLEIYNSKLKTLDLAGVQDIKILNLGACKKLKELHMPVENYELESFKIYNCSLKTLDLAGAQVIRNLDLYICEEQEELHLPIKNFKLESLEICNSKLKTLDLGGVQDIKNLNLDACKKLKELRMPVENYELESFKICNSTLKALDLAGAQVIRNLDLYSCEELEELHMPVKNFELESLEIFNSKLKSLDLARAQNIKNLHLYECKELEELYMPDENFMLESVDVRYSKLKTLDLTRAQNIENLFLCACEELEDLNVPVVIVKLKSVEIRYSRWGTLDLVQAQNLETLTLLECDNMVELHMPVESIMLKNLSLRCSKLKTLNLTLILNLKRLNLKECEELETLHMPVENFKLKFLFICNTKLKALDLSGARNLGTLHVERCKDLVELQMPVKSLKLKDLCLKHSKLKSLDLEWDLNLKKLNLTECEDLRTLYLGASPNLKRLDLKKCCNMEEIHAPIGCLNDRVHISSSGCVGLNPFLVNQGSPMVLAGLHLITRSLGTECQLHPHNNLHKLNLECVYVEPQPLLAGNIEKHISVHLYSCKNLASFLGSSSGLRRLRKLTLEGSILEFPIELELLECLEELDLLSTKIEHLPDSICMLKNLKVLRLESCLLLKQLPEDIGRLECLEELHLTNCTSLRDIPSSVFEMKCLKYFHFTN